MEHLTCLMQLVEDLDTVAIESARGQVRQEDVSPLLRLYWLLDDWEKKRALVTLLQDQVDPAMEKVMLDFLRAPVEQGDEYAELCQVIALGFVGEEYDRFHDYYNDRRLLRQAVQQCLQEHGLEMDKGAGAPAKKPAPTPPPPYTGDRQRRLLRAATEGNLAELQRALEHGAPIEGQETEGMYVGCTALLLAMIKGQFHAAGWLIDQGADVNARRPRSGQTPLSWAAFWGHLALTRKLCQKGARVNERDGYGGTALQQAAKVGAAEVVAFLLEQGADVDAAYNDGRKPIFFAAEAGHSGVVRLLIEAGNDVDEDRGNGWTPLTFAAANGHLDMVRMLLELGATVDVRSRLAGSEGFTPLMYAVRGGFGRVVKLLLQAGARADLRVDEGIEPYRGPYRGYTAIDFATGRRGETIQKLLRAARPGQTADEQPSKNSS